MSAALAWFPLSSPAETSSGNHLQLSKEDICHLAKITPRSFERRVKNAPPPGVISVRLPQAARNGRPVHKYLVASLPADLRDKVLNAYHARPKPVEVLETRATRKAHEVAPLFAESEATQAAGLAAPALLAELSPRDRKRAEARHSAILPLIEYDLPGRRAVYTALKLQDGRPVTTTNLLAEYLAQTVTVEGKAVSPRTLWNWLKLFRQGGDAALGRKPRKDRGTSSFFTKYPAAAALAESEYLKPGVPYTRVQNAIYRDQELLRIPDAELPDYKTVKRFCDRISRPAVLLTRHGQKAWAAKCAPYVTRKYTDRLPGDIYVADHCVSDVLLRNDGVFWDVPLNAPIRVRFTAIMDMRSRGFVGYCFASEGNSRSIATALRSAIERYGPPKLFLTDNGNDFKKLAKGAGRFRLTPEQIQESYRFLQSTGALAQLNIPVQFCRPYSAQSKNIERAFRFFHDDYESLFPHWLTGNLHNRPDQTVIAEAQHRRLMKHGLGSVSPLLPVSKYIQWARTWIEEIYNAKHEHEGRGMYGRTANSIFDELYPLKDRRKADPEILATLLYERRKAKVQNNAVTIDYERYLPLLSDPATYGSFHLLNGQSVILAFDPLDPVQAVAIDDRGRRYKLYRERLAEHPLGSLAEEAPETAELIAATLQMKGRLLSAVTAGVVRRHKTSAEAGHKSDIVHLAELAAKTYPVDPSMISQRAADQRQIRQNTRPSEDAHAPNSSYDIAAEFLGELLA